MEAHHLSLVVLLGFLAAFSALGWWRAHTRIRRNNLARQAVARVGEEEAERLLERGGYRVVDRQVTGAFTLWIDDEPVALRCRADLLVERRGERFVAEVKTGSRAPDPTHPATRRQLMEYLVAFPVSGVILVDMERRVLRRVGQWEAADGAADTG